MGATGGVMPAHPATVAATESSCTGCGQSTIRRLYTGEPVCAPCRRRRWIASVRAEVWRLLQLRTTMRDKRWNGRVYLDKTPALVADESGLRAERRLPPVPRTEDC